MKRTLCALALTAVLIIPFSGKAHAYTTPITVELMNGNYVGNQTAIPFTLSTSYQVAGMAVTLQPGISYTVKNESGTMAIYNGASQVTRGTSLTLIPGSYTYSNYITLNQGKTGQRIYLGDMNFRADGSYVRPYNTLELEDYLKGVVPSEMSDSWGSNGGEEALKVQAVAARTYITPHLSGQNSNIINDTTGFQVYDGYHPTYTNTNKAVNETAGQTVIYNGSPISAVYSSSNGGYTETSNGAWGGTNVPYLIAKADPFDEVKPFSYSISESSLLANANLMSSIQSAIGNKQVVHIKTIVPSQIDEGQRPKWLSFHVVTSTGAEADGNVLTTSVRSMVGNTLIKSNYITNISFSNGIFTFSGTGYGHGVGMSQTGAYKMSRLGYDYKNILGFYYPNTKLKTGSATENLIFSYNGTGATDIANIQNPYIINYNGPSLNVSFYAPAKGYVDIGIYDENGSLVKQMTTKTWQNAGNIYFPLTNPGLNGNYQIRLRYETYIGNVYYYNQNIKLSTDNPEFTSASANVTGQTLTATFTTNKTGYLLVEIVDSLGNRYAVLDPYVSRGAGSYSITKNLTQLNGKYLVRFKMFNDIGKVTDEREVNVAFQGNIPFYGNSIKTGSAAKQIGLFSDIAKQTKITDVYANETVKVIRNMTESNLYEIEYNGQTGYVDYSSLSLVKQPVISIAVNGYNLTMDTNPVVKNQRTLVPVRWVADGLGFDSVVWDGTNQIAILKKGTKTIELPYLKNYAYVDGEKVMLDATIEAVDGRLIIPLRFVSEQIGAEVSWDGNHNMIWLKQ